MAAVHPAQFWTAVPRQLEAFRGSRLLERRTRRNGGLRLAPFGSDFRALSVIFTRPRRFVWALDDARAPFLSPYPLTRAFSLWHARARVKIKKAVITAAGRDQRRLPLQVLVDSDGA